jgi:uncharacterized protein
MEVRMADSDNQGQFGNRDDTEEQAHKDGEESNGSFGDKNSVDPQETEQASSTDQQSSESQASNGRQNDDDSDDDDEDESEGI